jgi:hypothetical protein
MTATVTPLRPLSDSLARQVALVASIAHPHDMEAARRLASLITPLLHLAHLEGHTIGLEQAGAMLRRLQPEKVPVRAGGQPEQRA